MKDGQEDVSSRLRNLASELRAIDRDLKSEEIRPEKTALQDFREMLDNVRLTAWTVHELMNARETRENPEPLLSFLAAERLRRLSSMIRDLCADMDRQVLTWQSSGIQALSDSVLGLQSRITKLIAHHRPVLQRDRRAGGSGD
ncbi:MAG TPA: hypothetical protein VFP59_05400 [Candidatus Angelobacter sp.]|nr:hypothetical protein [Candidatus Angelobacter sp.]